MRKLELIVKNTMETSVSELALMNDSSEILFVSVFECDGDMVFTISKQSMLEYLTGNTDATEDIDIEIVEQYNDDSYNESAYAEYIDIVRKAYWLI